MNNAFPFLHIQGSHYEMGVQIGSNLKEKILRFIDTITEGLPLETAKERARAFIPSFNTHCPHVLEEIQGIADGAGISLEEAMIPNLRGAIRLVPGCTAFVIAKEHSKEGTMLIGQNQDMPAVMEEYGVVLHFIPDNDQQILMWTFAGLVGYHGINASGLGIFCNSLPEPPSNGTFTPDSVIPGYAVKRLMLEQTTIEEVLDLLDRTKEYPSPFGQGNYVLCDTDEIVDVELYNGGFAHITDRGNGYIAHTNHYVAEELLSLNRYTLPSLLRAAHEVDSMPRLASINRLFADLGDEIGVEDIKQVLRDHENFPRSICRHDSGPGSSITVVSIIAEPEHGRMHLCRGNPCAGEYETYTME